MTKELQRIYKACAYSRDGLCAAWREGGAFRTEVILTPFVILAAFCLAGDRRGLALLIASWLMVIITELLNTGIEAVTDLAAQGEIHPQAKKAKDAGSAAVFVACLTCGIVWLCVLI